MTGDAELLRCFAATGAEDAFAELVRRHVNLVYSTALRQVNGDRALAEEVTQSVFADLAQKADSLSGRASLTGWLYTGAHFAASKVVRGENRRRLREQEAHAMQQIDRTSGAELQWEQVQPIIDDAMLELPETDRDAILQRYFEGKPFSQVGALLGLTENAARMRVERALDKLRALLASRGVVATSTALAAVLGAHAVSAAPATLTTAVVAASMATTTAVAAASIWSATSVAKLKVTAGVVGVLGIVAALLVQSEKLGRLEKENTLLRASVATNTSAPVAMSFSDSEELERLRREHLELLRLRGEVGRLRRELATTTSNIHTTNTSEVANEPAQELPVHQVHINAQFFTGSKEDLAKLGLVEDSTAIFDENQTAQLLKMTKESGSLDFTGQMEVTTLSERQAQVSATRSVTNSEGVKTIGPVLDVLPKVQADGWTIEVDFHARLEEDTSYVSIGKDGTSPLPVLSKNDMFVKTIVWDGQTLVATKRTPRLPLVMLITPRLIDRAGDAIHAQTERPMAEAK